MPVICPLSTLRSLLRIDLREAYPKRKIKTLSWGEIHKAALYGFSHFRCLESRSEILSFL